MLLKQLKCLCFVFFSFFFFNQEIMETLETFRSYLSPQPQGVEPSFLSSLLLFVSRALFVAEGWLAQHN